MKQLIIDLSFPYTTRWDWPYTHDKTIPCMQVVRDPSKTDHNAHGTHWLDICHRLTTHLLLKFSHNCSIRSRGLPRHLIRLRCYQRSFIKSKPFARFRTCVHCKCNIMRFSCSLGSWRSCWSSLLNRGDRNCVCKVV